MKAKFKLVAWRAIPIVAAIGAVACTPLMDSKPDYDVRPVMTTTSRDVPADEGYYLSAVDAIKKRDYGLALDFLQAARAVEPNSARILNAFGVVYDKLGRFDLSARYYTEAKTADPQSTIVANNIAYSQVLQHLLNGDVPPSQLAASGSSPKIPVVIESETKVVPDLPRELAQAPVPNATVSVGRLADMEIDSLKLGATTNNAQNAIDNPIASSGGQPVREISAAPINVAEIQAPHLVDLKPAALQSQEIPAETIVAPRMDVRIKNVASDFLFQPTPLASQDAPAASQSIADLNDLTAAYHPVLEQDALQTAPVAPRLLTMATALESEAVATADRPVRSVAASQISLPHDVSPALTSVTLAALEVGAVENESASTNAMPAVLTETKRAVAAAPARTKHFVPTRLQDRPKVLLTSVSHGATAKAASRLAGTRPAPIKPAIVQATASKQGARPSNVRVALSKVPRQATRVASKPVILTHHPLVIVNASAQRSVDDLIRRALARRNWTIAPARLAIPRREAQTTLYYARGDYAVAKGLARTLAMPIHFVPNGCRCVGLRLVIGTNALNRRYSELERSPLQVGALTTTLIGSSWQERAQW